MCRPLQRSKIFSEHTYPTAPRGSHVGDVVELPIKLRSSVMLIKDTQASGAIADDAELLATYQSGFNRG
jgi:hypothetical protein